MVSVGVVFPEATGLRDSQLNYLDCLQAMTPPPDHLLVYSLDPRVRVTGLPILPSSSADICHGAAVVSRHKTMREVPVFTTWIANEREVSSTSRERIHRFRPQGPWRKTWIASFVPNEVLRQLSDFDEINPVVIDLRSDDLSPYLEIDWANPRVRSVTVVTEDVSDETVNHFERLFLSVGMRRAGRLWGCAGSTRAYRRPTNMIDELRAWFAQTRVDIGNFIVRRRGLRVLRKMSVSPLDSVTYASLALPTGGEVDRFLAAGQVHGDVASRRVTFTPNDVPPVAREAHRKFGVYPISFSHPHPRELEQTLDGWLSPIVPGYPYAFFDEEEYLGFYSRFALGVTHRKAGWDCFRHVEILAAGAVPLMLDAEQIPRFSMIHYPKEAMAEVARQYRQQGVAPDWQTRLDFRSHFLQHLTSEAMARYIMDHAGISNSQRVLFIDRQLPNSVDYQSTLSLIGLKQSLGQACEVAYPVEYLYADSMASTSGLYGRGFGYSRVLDPVLATPNEYAVENNFVWSWVDDFDAVVVGSVSRNREIADRLVIDFPEKKKIFIHGEDTPPELLDLNRLRAPGVVGFVRSIHAG